MYHAHKRGSWPVFIVGCFVALVLVGCLGSGKHHNRKFTARMNDSIFGVNVEQLTRAQAKITYLGEQDKPIPTVIFSSEGFVVEPDKFLKMQGDPIPYDNDRSRQTQSFAVSTQEFHRIILSVKPILEALDSSQKPEFLSFTVTCDTESGLIGHEYLLDDGQGDGFYSALIEALDKGNIVGREAISKQYRNIYPEIE